ncbi:Serrate RNA effector molecule [Schistosoma japonicum]|nr:Serrate RNA effector molecule [Schistosoma japonicum]KAH8874085.1 Serrate RNA effector molecule [Schistosoma japonicum]KAH8874086.1 Serrate RNA effector molecule [Schistosoma japonicum]KAH8874088.1 Serrate RNA effector molecule [Schistosoma japonicum]
MVTGKDTDVIDTPDNLKNNILNYGYSLRKGDFAQRPMSMKKFLEPFDHSSLTNAEAGEKYAAYKASFARQQLEEFFERNKAYAWFREKYHPDYCAESSFTSKVFERRLDVFMEFHQSGYFDNLHLTSGYESEIVRLLDMVAIKLAGGTQEDFSLLDKLLKDRNSENCNGVIDQSTFHHEEDLKANNNIVQPSTILEDPYDKEEFDRITTKESVNSF